MKESVAAEPGCSAAPRAGRQETRTRETRELLLRAAKTIFIRDGYEGADLKDIAELAGRTKGAIYGHFKSKEDIFLALIAEHREEYREKMRQLMSRDQVKNLAVMRQFVIDLADDSDWALLQLEFKMFTLRHPETKERFQSMYAAPYGDRDHMYTKMLGPAAKGAISRPMAVHSILPMLTALLLEAEFEPGLMSKAAIKKVIAAVFDRMLG